jgi:hypothetical protein
MVEPPRVADVDERKPVDSEPVSSELCAFAPNPM